MEKIDQKEQYRFVIKELVTREVKRKYSRSYLGIIWSVLNPLLYMLIITLIFSQIFSKSIENYPIYFLTGNIIWSLFTTATSSSMTALVDNKKLLIKVKFPMSIFVLARSYTALVNFGYSMVAYVIMLVAFKVTPTWTMLLFPIIIALLFMFALGMSYLLATAYVFFGDVKHLYSVILTMWMYCSAIFYPIDSISGVMRTVIEINPLYVYIWCARCVVMYGTVPTMIEMAQVIIYAVVMYGIGYGCYNKNKNKVMQKL